MQQDMPSLLTRFLRHPGQRLRLDRRAALLLAALLLALICLARPAALLPRPQHDWFFVVDITQSMNVRDYGEEQAAISRLAESKYTLRQTLRALPCGARVALGLFTERSTTPITRPLEVCAHFGALDETINGIDWRMAWAADSFITHGLFSAIEQTARNGAGFHLAFFTDGHQAPPSNVDYLPKFSGKPGAVNGIIVGVGSRQPGRIPKLDEQDNITGYWELDDVMRFATFGVSRKTMSVQDMENYHGRNAPHGGNPAEQADAHLSALNEGALAQLADTTGLGYMTLTKSSEVVSRLTSHRMANWRRAITDLRPVFALPALLLLLAFYLPPAFFTRINKRARSSLRVLRPHFKPRRIT